ncbi:xanthine dehydrogenase accessory protein XdhC [Oryzibacter oryziterrae]|uniref:xanthine dehydrogenase accessory protein XdhC n=1 Tax=Oryzibacter oryziterrae TaxID=2766474 RepID=UPI001F01B93A|nr:xanthine dehydrogenase accessory protein XdhC [Oryzibacter oryziterrae]
MDTLSVREWKALMLQGSDDTSAVPDYTCPMSDVFAPLARLVARDGIAALITVADARGSTPREAGARMILSRDGAISGTIGGGRLELEATERAQAMMKAGQETAERLSLALGPSTGQCCGGHASLIVEVFTAGRTGHLQSLAAAEQGGPFQTEAQFVAGQPIDRRVTSRDRRPAFAQLDASGWLVEGFGRLMHPVALFGAGHVGRAIVLALAPLPFDVTLIDSRAEALPGLPFAHLKERYAPEPAALVAELAPDTSILIMTHDHGLDLDILHAALVRGGFPYVGMIGSATKRARFERRLRDLGHDAEMAGAFACPIGIPGILSKEPAVIAASVAADLLTRLPG